MLLSLARRLAPQRLQLLTALAALIATCAIAPGCDGDGPVEPPDTQGPAVTLDALPSVTNQSTVSVAGSTESGAGVEVTGGASTVTGTANASGRFSLNVTLRANQANDLSVVGIDSVGNRGSAAQATVVHDDVAPAAPTMTVPEYSNQSQVVVEGTAEAGATVQVEQGSASAEGTADASGAYSISIGLQPNASNTITATARDRAGNEGPSASATVIHDDVPPSMTITDPDDGSVTPAPPSSFPIALEYSDGGSGIDTETLQLAADRTILGMLQQDGTDIADIPAGTNLLEIAEILSEFTITETNADWDFDGTRWAFAEGANQLSASITDRAGNTSLPEAVSFDATAPDNQLVVIFASADAGTAGNVLPVGLVNFEELGGINFTLNFDPGVLTVDSVKSTGHVTFAADSNADTDGGTGAVTTILVDVGGDPILTGADIVLEFFVTVAGGAPSGGVPITLTDVAVSGIDGNPAAMLVTDGSFTIN